MFERDRGNENKRVYTTIDGTIVRRSSESGLQLRYENLKDQTLSARFICIKEKFNEPNTISQYRCLSPDSVF